MKISEIDKAMGVAYREHKRANGGHKTSPKGKYGFKSIQFKVTEPDGTVYGPFLGRGSALSAFKNEIKLKGKPTLGVKFLIEEIFKHRNKENPSVIDNTREFEVTSEIK